LSLTKNRKQIYEREKRKDGKLQIIYFKSFFSNFI